MTENDYALSEIRCYWDEEAATFDDEPDHGLGDLSIRTTWRKLLQEPLPLPQVQFSTRAAA